MAARRMLHLGVLYALAVAQPLFSVLGKNAEFFVSRDATPGDIVLFALAAALVPPLVAGLIEAAVTRASERAGAVLQLVLIAVLCSLLAAQIVKKVGDPGTAPFIVIAVLAGAAGAALYARVETLRKVMTWFAPLPLLVLALFLLTGNVQTLVFPANAAAADVQAGRTPVVMVVFDEFTGTSLLDAHNRIDATMFPNFARLVRDGGVYYRNYTAAADETTRVVAALLTGDRWHEHTLPVAAAYPNNLFTLLGSSDRLVVSEEASALCPQSLCHEAREHGSRSTREHSLIADGALVFLHRIAPDELEERLTPVDQTLGPFTDVNIGRARVLHELGGGGRPARFEQWLHRIDGRDRTLYFKHVLLPHVPWQYLPDGRLYSGPQDAIPGIAGAKSFDDPWLLTQAYQRHLLQLEFTDRLLGRLIDRLRATHLYGRALVVVTADNGESFLHVGHDRHIADEVTFTDIADTPLIVKRPGRRHGGYDDRHVTTFDVLPTIAAAVGTHVPWRTEGRSIFGAVPPTGVVVAREQLSKGPVFSLSLDAYRRLRAEALRRKVTLFGSDDGGAGTWRVGPARDLLGRRLTTLDVHRSSRIRGSFAAGVAEDLADVDLRSGFLPVNVAGRLTGVGVRRGLPLALALNGRIAAVGRSAMLDDDPHVYFSFLAPPSRFRAGANRAEVFVVSGSEKHRRLDSVVAS